MTLLIQANWIFNTVINSLISNYVPWCMLDISVIYNNLLIHSILYFLFFKAKSVHVFFFFFMGTDSWFHVGQKRGSLALSAGAKGESGENIISGCFVRGWVPVHRVLVTPIPTKSTVTSHHPPPRN